MRFFLKKALILLPSLNTAFLENRFTNNRLKKCIQSILKDRSLWDIEISIFWSKKLTGEWQPHLQGGIFWFGKAFSALQFLSVQLSRKLLKILKMAFQLCVTFKCFQRRTFYTLILLTYEYYSTIEYYYFYYYYWIGAKLVETASPGTQNKILNFFYFSECFLWR